MDGRTLKGKVESIAGGVGRNLADCLTRLDTNPFFISVVGAQEHAEALFSKMNHMDKTGIKLIPDARTAVAVVVLDQYGDCLYYIADMNIHQRLSKELIDEHKEMICKAPIVVMDGNIPMDTMSYILNICSANNVPVWFEPTDLSIAFRPFKSSPLWKSSIAYASPNINELRVMHNTILDKDVPLSNGVDGHLNNILEETLCLGTPLLGSSLHTLVVTLGSRGVLLITNLHSNSQFPTATTPAQKGPIRAIYYPALQTKNIISVSGAGDCFASGMVGGILRGMQLDECIKVGQRSAVLSLASHHAVPETINPRDICHSHGLESEKDSIVLL